VTIFKNNGKQLLPITAIPGLEKSEGWWNVIHAVDLDGDGDDDFVLGNLGLNTKFKPAKDAPLTLYVNDFDQNGTVEQVICTYNGDIQYPMVLRHDLVTQIPSLRKKYLISLLLPVAYLIYIKLPKTLVPYSPADFQIQSLHSIR